MIGDRVATNDKMDSINDKVKHAKANRKQSDTEMPFGSSSVEQSNNQETDDSDEEPLFTPPKPKWLRSH